MTFNLTVRGAWAPQGALALLFMAICFLGFPASAFAGENKDQPKEQPEARTLVSTEPSVKPGWVNVVPQSDTEIFFVGTSQIFNCPKRNLRSGDSCLCYRNIHQQ